MNRLSTEDRTRAIEEIAVKAATDLIAWIAGPEPWQQWEINDVTDAFRRAITEARNLE